MAYKVLLLGATGYLGGTVLTDLERAGDFDVTCVVRPEREACMSGRRTRLLVVSHDELGKIEDACAEVDVAINAATSDDLHLTRAINRGLARRTGRKGVLVHISGTQLIESAPTGRLEDVPKYDDLDVEQIKSIPDTALHRLIDLEVSRADLADEITASIICPGVIFGRGSGPLKTISSPFPNLVRLALRNRRVTYAGEGTNIWAHVQAQDVSDLIIRSIRHNLGAAGAKPAGFERFYFAENGEHQKLDLCTKMASVLHANGAAVEAATPVSVSPDSPRAPSWANRTTARCWANRARRELGWRPAVLLEDVLEAEVLDILSAVRDEV
ncbi:NAD(P)-binding protein [Cryphonectria parasitica EP155]|uniref:NAD(P)-binding protein n=1 Tax=Cryphonectria parasitica (strain ATCC 38755 / EP155) TaxID=660469 RepID=A0A9P5CRT9_CRYP1|nr:NAD(P)-binding protein [Cryphonectria parasitica EP155]KAF3768919.1 NAD(P)-binding protein [Cryphonectria parasitica EP155]